MSELLPCPFCKGAVQFRKALWPSDGNVDAIIHTEPTACGMVDFSDGTTDQSILAKWNAALATRSSVPERERIALDELKRLYERYGWQTTADVIAHLEQT